MLTIYQIFSLHSGPTVQTKSNLTTVLDFNTGAKVSLH